AAIHHCRPPQPANCAAGSSGPTGLTRQGVDFRRDVTRYPAKFSLRIDPCDPSPNAASDGGPRSDPHGTFECHPADGPATETADPRDRTSHRFVAQYHQEVSELWHGRAEVRGSGASEQA